jgi:hypothetical protein
LGLNITQEDVAEQDHANNKATAYRRTTISTPTTRASTPSHTSVIQPRPSPYQPGSHDQEIATQLAESLQLNTPMSNMLTMEALAGTINPITGHISEDDVALYRAIGLDQPDPPSTAGREAR